ncbi:MAG: 1-deoxy-D-xylulose-5-phosphate reductoisomerase [Planctomycetota bacterium]
MSTRRILILGSTGSIGTQTLDVVRHLNALRDRGVSAKRFEIVGLAAGRNTELLQEQAAEFGVENAFAACDDAGCAERLVREVECDMVVAAISGSAGLQSTLAAAELGRDIAIANKESLVAAGKLVTGACFASGSRLYPVDSEHAGVWQALMGVVGPDAAYPVRTLPASVERVVLTASGGPFRGKRPDEVAEATVEQALAHPNWSMGAKNTIDSATLMNKGLELIEARWLFGVGNDRLDAIVQPTSVVHAMIEMADGSTIAQMSAPDMRTPIQLALMRGSIVERPARLDLVELGELRFERADPGLYPALGLAKRAIDEGGTAGATLNAANELAVEAFLGKRIRFREIVRLTADAMDAAPARPVNELGDVLDAARLAREHVERGISALS